MSQLGSYALLLALALSTYSFIGVWRLWYGPERNLSGWAKPPAAPASLCSQWFSSPH